MQIIMKLWQNFWSGDYRFWKIFFLKLFSFVYWTFSSEKKPSTKSAFYHEQKMVSKISCTKNVFLLMVFGVIKKNGKPLVESHGMHQFIRQKYEKRSAYTMLHSIGQTFKWENN